MTAAHLLDDPVRQILDGLRDRVATCDELVIILQNQAGDARNAYLDLLSGMATAIRLHGQHVSRIGDDLDAWIRQQRGGAR